MHWRRTFASLVCLPLAAFVAPAVGGSSPAVAAATGSLAGPSSVRTDEVCFTVHNEVDPLPSTVYGVRYYVGTPRPDTKVIVLVHGIGVDHAFWDVRPEFSVARNLAEAGYMVIGYDRLGYGKSPYRRPEGAGHQLTWSGHRAMLHEIVAQVKAGNYTSAASGTCPGTDEPPVGLASETVVLLGHSGGGLIVSGYPGIYHDVSAVVHAGYSNQGLSEAGTRYVAEVMAPQLAAGDDYFEPFPTPQDCRKAVLLLPEVVPSLLPSFCQAPNMRPAPAAELTSLGKTTMENLVSINRVGPGLPVLVVHMDHDFFFSADKQAAETEYWMANCGCDVEAWTQSATGHGFVAHRSMPTLTSKVVAWLASKGLAAM